MQDYRSSILESLESWLASIPSEQFVKDRTWLFEEHSDVTIGAALSFLVVDNNEASESEEEGK